LVRVRVTSLNVRDLVVIKGGLAGMDKLPLTLLSDGGGIWSRSVRASRL
jgi:NADPH:quinone reductase-like Zn-dependent oxidoreductase